LTSKLEKRGNNMEYTKTLGRVSSAQLSVKGQLLATLAGAGMAVALPRLVHALGAFAGEGTGLGELLLPMHLPVMLVGFAAGPWAGAAVGLLAPVISFLFSGMPMVSMLPFMVIELAVYGFAAGWLKNHEMPMVVKVVLVQLAGRAVRAAAILAGFYLLQTKVSPAVIYTSIAAGWLGILLQWAALPALNKWTERLVNHEG
jgi:hypothetical protein